MKIIAADDEKIALEQLVKTIEAVSDNAEVTSFENPRRLLEYARENPCDVAFLDIEMGALTGIDVAKQLKQWYPKINIIFVTGYDEYMHEAFKLRASGYVEKPVTEKAIREELDELRTPVSFESSDKLVVKCFGNFEVFVNGKPLKFERTKTKEMLAYLIDRKGGIVSSSDIRKVLWDKTDQSANSSSYFQKVKKDLVTTLKKAGVGDVLVTSWNKYSINTDNVSCDYYAYLNDRPDGIRAYNGEYMNQYDWARMSR
ncbi:response regulator [Ligilactobacillus sp.]|uniref:response regulator n=1 Tax=Ligilactobacillus sp. TaxID=2767921 RepID=UPI002FE006A0